MVKRTDSLSFRITLLSMIALLCCTLIIGGFGIHAIRREGDRDTSRHMNLICDDRSKALNEFLISVEQSANMVSRFIADDISSMELVKGGVIGASGEEAYDPEAHPNAAANARLQDYLSEHTLRVLSVFRSAANNTHGVFSYYYRLNPQFSSRPMGFWHEKKSDNSFADMRLTEITARGDGDMSGTEWYYIPLHCGEHIWIAPYYNKNLDAKIISYAVPVYKAGTFIGIVGMDISYDTLVEQVSGIRLFETGYAFLTMENGEIVYHPGMDPGENHQAFSPELTPVAEFFEGKDGSGENTFSYTFKGEKKEMAFNTLANGMKLVVVAPSSEINAGWHHLVRQVIIAGVMVITLFGAVISFAMKRVTNPLEKLTEASQHLAEGNYDMELNYGRRDEVGVLTEAFGKLTAHLRMYISDLNSRAYRDAMTGLRNKGAFDISLGRLNDECKNPGMGDGIRFAMVMFDCDELKRVNDVYGHEKGDIYLQTACRLICRIYCHSPVFRIGGDEFAALLRGEDFERRDELLEDFDRNAEMVNEAAENPWEKVRVSKGMAVYDPALDENAENVLSRADAMMYREKNEKKKRAAD